MRNGIRRANSEAVFLIRPPAAAKGASARAGNAIAMRCRLEAEGLECRPAGENLKSFDVAEVMHFAGMNRGDPIRSGVGSVPGRATAGGPTQKAPAAERGAVDQRAQRGCLRDHWYIGRLLGRAVVSEGEQTSNFLASSGFEAGFYHLLFPAGLRSMVRAWGSSGIDPQSEVFALFDSPIGRFDSDHRSSSDRDGFRIVLDIVIGHIISTDKAGGRLDVSNGVTGGFRRGSGRI